MDFRIKPSVLGQLLDKVGYPEGSYDLVSVAGSAKDFLGNNSEKEFLLKQVRLSQKLHNIREVIILYHDNCSAYGISDAEQEHETQASDLAKIKSLLTNDFPDLVFSAHIIRGVSVDNLSLEKNI
jgi:hypothetical protein